MGLKVWNYPDAGSSMESLSLPEAGGCNSHYAYRPVRDRPIKRSVDCLW
jgi:hypothetical protein